jgi:hypothetical protein
MLHANIQTAQHELRGNEFRIACYVGEPVDVSGAVERLDGPPIEIEGRRFRAMEPGILRVRVVGEFEKATQTFVIFPATALASKGIEWAFRRSPALERDRLKRRAIQTLCQSPRLTSASLAAALAEAPSHGLTAALLQLTDEQGLDWVCYGANNP